MRDPINDTIKELLNEKLNALELELHADFISFYGPIINAFASYIKPVIEEIAGEKKNQTLYFMITTPGGSAEQVERAVDVMRHFYDEVNFIVPNCAYSAGTILCMSGDNILMDYFGVLGPIDPQIPNKDNMLVPALGYLDKINELVEKSRNNTLTNAEFAMLNKLDLADIRSYEQARELTIDLLKKWLVQYKFKNWTKHETSLDKKGSPVSQDDKIERAEEIAKKLSDNNFWKSHGRGINLYTLENELRLKIIDYGKNQKLSALIGDYYSFIINYIFKDPYRKVDLFTHTRRFL